MCTVGVPQQLSVGVCSDVSQSYEYIQGVWVGDICVGVCLVMLCRAPVGRCGAW